MEERLRWLLFIYHGNQISAWSYMYGWGLSDIQYTIKLSNERLRQQCQAISKFINTFLYRKYKCSYGLEIEIEYYKKKKNHIVWYTVTKMLSVEQIVAVFCGDNDCFMILSFCWITMNTFWCARNDETGCINYNQSTFHVLRGSYLHFCFSGVYENK